MGHPHAPAHPLHPPAAPYPAHHHQSQPPQQQLHHALSSHNSSSVAQHPSYVQPQPQQQQQHHHYHHHHHQHQQQQQQHPQQRPHLPSDPHAGTTQISSSPIAVSSQLSSLTARDRSNSLPTRALPFVSLASAAGVTMPAPSGGGFGGTGRSEP